MPLITMTTDFGTQDGFIGVMKGVILGIAPEVQIVDLSHQIAPQNILQGARLLHRHAGFFPPGTIHLAVVDPGVGTARRPMAARIGHQLFVAPDNGLLSLFIASARESGDYFEFYHLDNPSYWLKQVSRTFHGRDIFAPAAAHLAAGVPIAQLGKPFLDPVLIEQKPPERTETGWETAVTGIDIFGNLATNLHVERLGESLVQINVNGMQIHGLVGSYGDKKSGELVALIDSEGFLEVAVVNGSAAQRLGAAVGDRVEVQCG